jgi:hypothetical protein
MRGENRCLHARQGPGRGWRYKRHEVGSPVQDLAKDRAPHYKKARRFFDGVAAQLTQQQHSLDVFACALDQARRSVIPCALPLSSPCTDHCLQVTPLQ